MNMDYDRDSHEFWSSLYKSFASDPKDDLYPGIRSPIMLMSTSMSTDVPAEPWKVLEDGHKEAGPENAVAEVRAKNIYEVGEKSTQKAMEKGKEKEVAAKEVTKILGKRPRGNESRNLTEKRRRTDIRTKIETLKELTRCTGKRDHVSTLEFIVERIQEMKLCVETYSIGPMMPLGMGMDYQGPWMYPYAPPHFMMPYNHFAQGQTSSYGNHFDSNPVYVNHITPVTTQGVNNQPQTLNPM